MNLRQLRYFVHIAETESVSRAAEYLNVSQSALSARIKELEDELGRGLFTRNSRGVKLTADGKAFLPLALEALNAFKKAEDAFHVEDDRQAKVAVGVTPTLGMILIPHLVSHRNLYEDEVRFVIRQGSSAVLSDLLNRREIDAIVTYNENVGGIHPAYPLVTDKLVLVGSEAMLSTLETIDRQSLRKLPYVTEPSGHLLRNKVDAYFNVGGDHLEPVAELEPFEARRALVLSGDACAIAPKWVFDADLRESRMSVRHLGLEALSITMTLIISIDLDVHYRQILLRRFFRVLDPLIEMQPTMLKRYDASIEELGPARNPSRRP